MKKIMVLFMLILIISCGQKNYAKMSEEKFEKESMEYSKKIETNTATSKDIREFQKISIIRRMKQKGETVKDYNMSSIEDKYIGNMTTEELNLYVSFLEGKLYKNGNLSNREMENLNKALIFLDEYQRFEKAGNLFENN